MVEVPLSASTPALCRMRRVSLHLSYCFLCPPPRGHNVRTINLWQAVLSLVKSLQRFQLFMLITAAILKFELSVAVVSWLCVFIACLFVWVWEWADSGQHKKQPQYFFFYQSSCKAACFRQWN